MRCVGMARGHDLILENREKDEVATPRRWQGWLGGAHGQIAGTIRPGLFLRSLVGTWRAASLTDAGAFRWAAAAHSSGRPLRCGSSP
jgi:hypothetical protein